MVLIWGRVFLTIMPIVCVCARALSYVQLFAAPRTVACQAPLPMEFSRQEYLNGLPFLIIIFVNVLLATGITRKQILKFSPD